MKTMEVYNYNVKIRKTAKIRKCYKQEPHLTQDTTWVSDKNTKASPTRAKRSALSQKVRAAIKTRKHEEHKTQKT